MFDEPREPLALRLRALPRPRVQLEVAVRGVVVADPHPAQRRSLGAREVAEGLPSDRAAQNSAKAAGDASRVSVSKSGAPTTLR